MKIGKRWNEHRRSLLARRHHSTYLQRAWDKYGSAAFEFVVLMECAPVDLIHHEQSLIDQWRSADRAHGFNPRATASSNGPMSAETREKIGAANRGRKFSAEHRAKLSVAQRGHHRGGRKLTEAHRQKLSEFWKGRPKSAEHRRKIAVASRRYRATLETRQKISAAKRALGPHPAFLAGGRRAAARPKSAAHRAKIGAASRRTWAAMSPESQRAWTARMWERRRELYGSSGHKPKESAAAC